VIEPTEEMERAYAGGTGSPSWKLPPGHRAGLAAVLAIVERDRCMESKGHVAIQLRRSPGEVPWGLP
jgi:hypothetical protein